jgi:hypothetical protein
MKSFVLAAFAAVLITGCGSTASGSGPQPGPGAGFEVTATEKDRSVTMHTGQKIELVLHAAGGMKPWTHPVSSNTSVLTPIVDPAATAVRGVTLAAFQATEPGQVTVTANASLDCADGQPCAMLIEVYTLTVTVTK